MRPVYNALSFLLLAAAVAVPLGGSSRLAANGSDGCDGREAAWEKLCEFSNFNYGPVLAGHQNCPDPVDGACSGWRRVTAHFNRFNYTIQIQALVCKKAAVPEPTVICNPPFGCTVRQAQAACLDYTRCVPNFNGTACVDGATQTNYMGLFITVDCTCNY